jgi:hypothetical protein
MPAVPKVTSRQNAYMTSYYAYTEFQSLPGYISDRYSDSGLDTNNDGLFENLIIAIDSDIKVAGNLH